MASTTTVDLSVPAFVIGFRLLGTFLVGAIIP